MTEEFIDPVKICACCKESKPATYEFFYKQKKGLTSYCKECSKAYTKSYKHKDEHSSNSRTQRRS